MSDRLRPLMRFAGSTPKRGSAAHECDDGFSASGRRFAVADGVRENGYSGVWARILAESFCSAEPAHCSESCSAGPFRPRDATLPPQRGCRVGGPGMRGSRYAAEVDFEQAVDAPSAWLDVARAEWRRWSDAQAQRDLPWFARGVLRAGAFATFVGVAFPADAAESAWHAVACGDSCVFVVRDDRLEHAFPVTQSDAFDNTPRLVRTSPLATGDALRTSSGPLRAGDAFYLVTDALAQWFLSAADRGGKPWQTLDGVITPADLDALVTPLRASHVLRNDDVTLVSVVVAADA